ncbi:MAG: SCP2 sterol-binding domain-containing protein [Myxococcales bacterium]|nr:SCP2 sterol-binding domain-containing protein [Myxococcales bacterium]
MTPKEIFETRIPEALGKNPTLAKEVGAIVHFDLPGPLGGQWTLDLTREKDWVSAGLNGTAALTISASDADFVSVVSGKMNAQMAVMTGKLKFKPMNIVLATKLSKVLSAGRTAS